MRKEYVLRLSCRDADSPLTEQHLIDFGAADPRMLASAFVNLASLIRELGTPEKVAEFMLHNKVANSIRK